MVADSTADAAAGALAIYVIIGIAFYFLPTIVAVARHYRSTGSVVVVNLLLGWTVIGWVVALAMAFGSNQRDAQVVVYAQGSGYPSATPPSTQMSPDGRFWWDGSAWRDTFASVPPGAPRSADGAFWWDGNTWRATPGPAPAPPPGLATT
jgi:hypothetical protein